MTARREIPRVDRLLQELLRAVLPELAHRRVGVDDGVLQLAPYPLHLPDVDVLSGIAVGIHLDRHAWRIHDLERAEGGHERHAILEALGHRLVSLTHDARDSVAR